MSVTLMFTPSVRARSMAGTPSVVAGIFTMRLGRFTRFWYSRA